MSKYHVRPFVYAVLLCFSLSYSISAFAASGSPKVIQLVEVSSIEKSTLTVSWLPTNDDNTAHEDLVYRVYLSKKADFQPDSATLKLEKTGAVSAVITGLKPATPYYVVVTATDADDNVSWSNLLSGQTAAVNPKRTAVRVHELPSGQFAKSAQHYKAGDYLVSRENGGMLRKIDATSRSRQTTPTDHGSLNELFSELAFSSTIKLQDVPEQLTTSKQRQANITTSGQGGSVSWRETGLTLMGTPPPSNAKSAKNLIINKDQQTKIDRYLTMKAPAFVGVTPNENKQWVVEMVTMQSDYELCAAELSFTPPDDSQKDLPQPIAVFNHPTSYREGVLVINWTPTNSHIDMKGRFYTATVKAFVDNKSDACNGNKKTGRGWAQTMEITTPVYVAQGEFSHTENQRLFSVKNPKGNITVDNSFTFSMTPDVVISAEIRQRKLQSAVIKAVADLSFSNQLTIKADSKGAFSKRVTLAEKSFIKIYLAGLVPVVVSGTFKIDAELSGTIKGAAKLDKLLELKFPDTEFGLEYHDNAWHVIKHQNPSYTFAISGEADADAEITAKLIPDMQLSFYDAATGRLIVEPYAYAEAGIHGQFKYQDENGATLTDLDYWFSKLGTGIGADLYLYAGLSIFDYTLLAYPDHAVYGDIKTYQVDPPLLAKTTLAQLPKLSAAINNAPTLTDNSESRLIYIQGKAKDYEAPYPFNLTSIKNLFHFVEWTPPSLVTSATGAQLTASTRAGGYWLKYQNPGEYGVRLAGYSNLGWFIRQIAETTITLTDDDHDGMVDQWEQRFGITDPNADDDHDGVSNLAEFNAGYQPNNAGSSPFVLTGTSGDKQVTLKWNAVNGASGYSLCRATERIVDVNNCLNYAGGVWEDTNGTDFTATGLVNGAKYYFRVSAGNADTTLRVSNVLAATPGKAYGLNDTGITACSIYGQNGLSCPVDGYPGQDAEFGRDVTQNDDSNGHAGFNFTKISGSGAALAANAASWNCVKDNVTGLIWEVKTDDSGLHDKDWYYSWYEPDTTKNGGYAGYQNSGSCSGSACDTYAYIQAVNAAGWCGYNDWRLPTVDELSDIASLDRYNPAIDTDYFPNTQSAWYWSSSPVAISGDDAWDVYFDNGGSSWGIKGNRYYVRLVRSGQ